MAKKILDGIRVLDFGVVYAGPYGARILAELGAEVLRVEHPKLRGVMGTYRAGGGAELAKALGMDAPNIGKSMVGDAPWLGIRDGYSSSYMGMRVYVALDTTKPEGKDILNQLLKVSDVVMHNVTPDVVKRLGITYEDLKAVNPKIINCTMPAFCSEGPWANYMAYGNTMEYLTGMTSLTGYGGDDGDRPVPLGVFTVDPVSGMMAAGVIVSALMYRQRTGEGQNIELAQAEVGAGFVNREILDYTMNGVVRTPAGNNDRDVPFQGCYRAGGSDQWVVLAIRSQNEWAALCHTIGKATWARDARFSDLTKLNDMRPEIDAAVTAWTSRQKKEEAARLLQVVNIPAAPVNNLVETVYDPQLRHRGTYKWIQYPYGPSAPTPCMPARFSQTPLPEAYVPARAVGADNDYVYRRLLGLSEAKIKELEEKKIIQR